MAEKIGPQHGIEAARVRWKALDPGKAWPDKLADTLTTLVEGYNDLVDRIDGSAPDPEPEPEPEPEPPPPTKRYAPRTHNSTERADARFCMAPEYGVRPRIGGFIDEMGVLYDDKGLDLGGRSKLIVPGLKGADSMDGLEPCDTYTHEGNRFPPWPPKSYLQ